MSDIRFGRREALGGLLVLGGAAGLGSLGHLAPVAFADGPEVDRRQRFVFCYFSGGWDILLGLDPRDPGIFTAERINETRIQPAYELLERADANIIQRGDFTLGPYVGDLANLTEHMCIVRGMNMNTLAHEVGRRRFITGKAPSGLLARGSSIATWLAGYLGAADALPNLAMQVESYNRDMPPAITALSTDSTNDLVRALRPAEPLTDPRLDALLNQFHADQGRCARARRSVSWQIAEGGRQKAQEMVAANLGDLFDLARAEHEDLRNRYNIPNGFSASSPEVQAAMAAQAVMNGISRCVSIRVASGLDTHFSEWADDQGPTQERGFNAIGSLVRHLRDVSFPDGSGDSWLDHTTIIGFSEFSRTALLNARVGRDHSLTNACLLMGGRVRRGQTIGASTDVGLSPSPINVETGELSMDGEVIRPEHILRELMIQAGITDDVADLRVPGLPAAFIG